MNQNIPRPGDARWSKFFAAYVYLVEYVSDDEWYFKFNRNPKVFEAQTRWSEMKEHPDHHEVNITE